MINIAQIFEKSQVKRKIPRIKPGDTVRVYQKVATEAKKTVKKKEKKEETGQDAKQERIQIFEGTVIKVHGGYGINGTFTVRKISENIGVEKTFPFHLPTLTKIEVIKRGKVRRAKLYYLRRREEKAARLKEKKMAAEELAKLKYEEESVEKDKPKEKIKKTQIKTSKKEEKTT